MLRECGLTTLRVIDDHDGLERSVEEMQEVFIADADGARYGNFLANR